MAADNPANIDTQSVESSEPRPRRVADIGFDAKLAPTCMIWSMWVALGFLIAIMLFWGVGNFGTLLK